MLGSAGATSLPEVNPCRTIPDPTIAAFGPRPLVSDLLRLVRLSLCSCRLEGGGPIVITPGTWYRWRQHATFGSLMRQVGDRAAAACCGLLLAAAAECANLAARRSAL
jgi:hypothetical protein